MLHTSFIELSKSALRNNIRYMMDLVGPNTKYSMVVKANAYGHGIEEIVGAAEEIGVRHFSVFSVVEAMRAHDVIGDDTELMIMGWIDDDNHRWVVENGISYHAFSIERLYDALRTSKELGIPARIHLELETGMHRVGFTGKQLEKAVEVITEHRQHFIIEGVCTHFAGAESAENYDRVTDQLQVFNELCEWLEQHGVEPKTRHTACSAAVFNFPESVMDMVRVGIANYGYWPSPETRINNLSTGDTMHDFPDDPLKRVLTWKSVILSLNQVGEGEYISYGKSFITNRDSVIGTVPVGYGYGYNRTLSNNGHVLVRGHRVPVVGTVNMNMLVIDVTDIEGVSVGDEVVLIGSQGDLTISVSSFVEMNNSMNYEMLTRLPDHIPRSMVE